MAVKIEKKTDQKKLLKIISVVDSAIDWEASYQNPSDLQEDDEELDDGEADDGKLPRVVDMPDMDETERKQAHYRRHHDESKLKFKAGDLPTLFVFAHPHRVDVARKMRELASGMYADSQRGNKGKVDRDMFSAVFHHFYLGMEQGFSGEREPVQRVNGRLTDDAVQALEDAEVFIELNAAFMRVYNQDRSKLRKDNSEK